jgi:hypothetical protein
MASIDSGSKSSRLLASRRYTHDTLTSAQESFTNVLDLGTDEIYTQTGLIPSTGLPFSGSSQIGSTYTAYGKTVMKYWYRQKLTKSNTNNEVWFFLDPTGSDSGIGAQLINDNQQTNFVSPKYSVSALATSTTADSTPGYLAAIYKSSAVSHSLQTGSLDGDDIVSTNDYEFDYKTGIVQFKSSATDPTNSQYLYMTVNQYVGTTLSTGISGSAASTGSFGRVEADSIEANRFIVSSSVTNITTQYQSGSSTFGDTMDDVHQRTGSLGITGSFELQGASTDAFTYGSTTWNEDGGANSITGSDFFFKSTGGGFDIYDNSDALMFKIDNKVAVLGTITGVAPTAVAGGLYYSGSDAWYLGYNSEPS